MVEDKLRELKKKLDVLNEKPDQGVSGRRKVDILNDLASEVVLSDCGAAEDYARQAVELAERLDYHKGGARSYRLLGLSYEYRSRYEETLVCYREALNISRKSRDKRGIAKAVLNIGGIYADLGHFDKALKYQLEALRYSEEIGNKHDIAASHINIGATYEHLKNFEQGAQHNIKALKIFEKIDHAEGIADAASNIGGCYAMLGDHSKAFKYASRALTMYRELDETHKMAQILLILGTIYGERNDNKRALAYYTEALRNYEKVEAKKGIAYACNNIGEIERRLGHYDSAFTSLQRALKTAQEIKTIENEMESYELLSKLSEARQNHEQALDYHKKYTNLKEKMFNAEKSRQLADMRTRYETEEKEKEAEIHRLKNVELRREIRKRKKAEEVLQKHRDDLEELVVERTSKLQNEIAERRKAEETLLSNQKQLRSLARELSLVEEKQRRKFATFLHDDVGQALALVTFKLRAVQEAKRDKKVNKELAEIKAIIDKTVERTRTLAFEISPPILYELGLESALEWLVRRFGEQYRIEGKFKDDGKHKPLLDDAKVFLFQSVRELLANVTKHAQAQRVNVSVAGDGSSLRIAVQDDGVGFSPKSMDKKVRKNEGFGLFNIRERLRHLRGYMEILSRKGKGTTVTLIVPFKRTMRKGTKRRA